MLCRIPTRAQRGATGMQRSCSSPCSPAVFYWFYLSVLGYETGALLGSSAPYSITGEGVEKQKGGGVWVWGSMGYMAKRLK